MSHFWHQFFNVLRHQDPVLAFWVTRRAGELKVARGTMSFKFTRWLKKSRSCSSNLKAICLSWAMSEIEPPWIATDNLELYHLRFHLRSRARQLGSNFTIKVLQVLCFHSTFVKVASFVYFQVTILILLRSVLWRFAVPIENLLSESSHAHNPRWKCVNPKSERTSWSSTCSFTLLATPRVCLIEKHKDRETE